MFLDAPHSSSGTFAFLNSIQTELKNISDSEWSQESRPTPHNWRNGALQK